jgi:Domain of unknown function (DUF4328)
MSIASRARKGWSRGEKITRTRGKVAVAALIGTAICHVYSAGVASWQIGLLEDVQLGRVPDAGALQLSDTLFQAGAVAEIVMRLITGVLFLRWLSQAVRVTRDLQVSPHLSWTPSAAVWCFFLPVVNLVRPYRVLRDLHDRLDPEGVPEPAPRPRLDGTGGYRKVELEKAPPPAKLPHASIGAWWALYLVGGAMGSAVAGNSGTGVPALLSTRKTLIASDAIQLCSAMLAILVVLTISARVAERRRRLHHASDEELESWGIDL